MTEIICDLAIELQTTHPQSDIKIARTVLSEYEKLFDLPANSFKLGPVESISMGWSYAILYLSQKFAQTLYEGNSYEIDQVKDPIRSYRYLKWLNTVLEKKGCNALLKYAESMKGQRLSDRYASSIVTVFSDEVS